MRLIDADELMDVYMDRLSLVADRYSPDSSECGILSGAMKLLDEQPTIEPERKKGKWLDDPDVYKCSACGAYFEIECGDGDMNFCPNCGADMRGEQPRPSYHSSARSNIRAHASGA